MGCCSKKNPEGVFLAGLLVGDERGGDGGCGQLCLVLGLQNMGPLQMGRIDYRISHPIEKTMVHLRNLTRTVRPEL